MHLSVEVYVACCIGEVVPSGLLLLECHGITEPGFFMPHSIETVALGDGLQG